ncbi:MAG: hypothetical protein ACUVWN_00845 [bacterium]
MQIINLFLMAEDEFTEISEPEAISDGGLLGDLSNNFRIIIFIVSAVLIYILMRDIYIVLINKEWHPSNAKLLSFSILFVLLCAVFTVLFVGKVMLFIIIAIWIIFIIFLVLALLKRRR